ncbi:MAG TPA: long-chain fatty acid--CoA ligase, partial [Pseudomonas sp.]|nr:long-chain fatty acid--CoA ligase [Pseudomonas sp.]
DARKGEAVKVFVSLREATDDQALLEHCRQFLTGYKLPSAIEIRDELPKTAVGKLLRRQLRDEARATG